MDRVLLTTDDLEPAVRTNAALEQAGFSTAMVSSLDDVRASVSGKHPPPDAIILTGGLHEPPAQRLLAAAREHGIPTLGFVEATDENPERIGYDLGLSEWLVKPTDPAEVTATVRRLIERHKLQQRTGILGESPAIQEVLVKTEQIAPVTSTVLIEGESGTGKELVARAIHDLSPRRGNAATSQSLKGAAALGTFRDDLYSRLTVLSVSRPPLRERRGDIPLLVRTFIAEFSRQHERSFHGITPEALQILVEADWPGNVRQLKNLIESMVVLAPEGEIRASDIPREIRERTLTMPVRIPAAQRGGGREITGQELEFIFRSLVELKVQLEDLRHRIDERPIERVEVIEVGPGSREQGGTRRIEASTADPLEPGPAEIESAVVYRPGMTMADVERAAIDAALRETRGNRRKAAEVLGIGERTLYRKLKDYALS